MEWQRYVRIGVYTAVFAIPFVGLIVANGFFFPFITGKNFAFRILVELAFAGWLILALWSPEYRPRKSLALILGGLFVLALGVSTVIAENPIKAFWSNFERMEGYIMLIHLAMYVTVLTSVLRTELMWRRFFNVSIGVSVLIGLYGLLQLSGALTINQGGVRVDGTLGNATYLAVYMLIHAFLTMLALARWAKDRWVQALYAAALLLQIVMIFYAATRGTILGLVGGIFLAGLIFTFSRGAGSLRKVGIGLIGLVIVLTGVFFAVRDNPYVQQHEILGRIASISVEAGETRFTIWSMALKGVAERPVFGWGQEGFNFIFNKYYTADLYTQEPWFDRAHNVLVDWLVAGGVVGLALYISLYLVLLYYLWRPGSQFDAAERAILTGLLAGYAFHNLFVFDNLMSYLLFMAVFSYITVRAVPPATWGQPIPAAAGRLAGPAVVLGSLAMLYIFNGPGIAAATEIIEGIKPQTAGITANAEYFKKAAAHTGLGAQEVAEQYLQFAVQVRSLNAGDQQLQLQVANDARDTFLRQIAVSPEDTRLRVFMGAYLRQFGDYAGAEEHLLKAYELTPQKQSIILELGTLELQKGNRPAALAYFKQAYDMAPGYEMAFSLYAAGAIRAGDTALAERLIAERYGGKTPTDPTLLQAYFEVKNFTKAIEIARARIAADPKNVRAYIDLGAIYMEMGNRAAAVQAVRDAIAADPTFKAQGEAYIAEIQAGQ